MIREIKAIVRHERVPDVFRALHEIPGLPGATLSVIQGFGRRVDTEAVSPEYGETVMAKIELVVPEAMVPAVTAAILRGAHTGRPGDGKIFVIAVENVINVRSGVQGLDAL
ncbi:MAG: P-II family nitrogen regulator [Acidobacteriota bacterium]|nr:P-II family nitrogen regulator [Acidobacteriota bacterium]